MWFYLVGYVYLHLSIYLSIYLCLYLYVYVFIYLFFIYLFIHLFIYMLPMVGWCSQRAVEQQNHLWSPSEAGYSLWTLRTGQELGDFAAENGTNAAKDEVRAGVTWTKTAVPGGFHPQEPRKVRQILFEHLKCFFFSPTSPRNGSAGPNSFPWVDRIQFCRDGFSELLSYCIANYTHLWVDPVEIPSLEKNEVGSTLIWKTDTTIGIFDITHIHFRSWWIMVAWRTRFQWLQTWIIPSSVWPELVRSFLDPNWKEMAMFQFAAWFTMIYHDLSN